MLASEFYGGSRTTVLSVSGNVILLRSSKRFQLFDAGVSGSEKVVLPDARTLDIGGPHFFIGNITTGGNDFDVETAAGVLFKTVLQGAAVGASLMDNTTLGGIWHGNGVLFFF